MVSHGHSLGLKVGSYMNNCVCMEGGDPPMGNHCNGETHYEQDVDFLVENGFDVRSANMYIFFPMCIYIYIYISRALADTDCWYPILCPPYVGEVEHITSATSRLSLQLPCMLTSVNSDDAVYSKGVKIDNCGASYVDVNDLARVAMNLQCHFTLLACLLTFSCFVCHVYCTAAVR